MKNNHKLALIVAYYLSRFYVDRKDPKPLENIGLQMGITKAYEEIGKRLDVKPRTIKNMRDHFDPLHGHRSGWHQESLRPSHIEVYEKYKHLSQEAMIEIVKEIINQNDLDNEIANNIAIYIDSINSEDEDKQKQQKEFGTRGITGKMAEEIFKEKFEKGEFNGATASLFDRRDDGCGYDFELGVRPKIVYEIKGLAGEKGGVSFTDKEWSVAKELKERYILVLISNINEEPKVKIVVNPYENLQAQKRVYTTIAINWSVGANQLD
ncbi:DUF3883 domain-containing protein [Ferdinandcohnia sp. Marseille-Q9671]